MKIEWEPHVSSWEKIVTMTLDISDPIPKWNIFAFVS